MALPDEAAEYLDDDCIDLTVDSDVELVSECICVSDDET